MCRPNGPMRKPSTDSLARSTRRLSNGDMLVGPLVALLDAELPSRLFGVKTPKKAPMNCTRICNAGAQILSGESGGGNDSTYSRMIFKGCYLNFDSRIHRFICVVRVQATLKTLITYDLKMGKPSALNFLIVTFVALGSFTYGFNSAYVRIRLPFLTVEYKLMKSKASWVW